MVSSAPFFLSSLHFTPQTMNFKDNDSTNNGAAMDTNQDGMIQPPPPSYAASTSDPASKYQSTSAAHQEAFYQAQPVGNSSQHPTTHPPSREYPPPSSGIYPPSANGYGYSANSYGPSPGSYVPPSGNYGPSSGEPVGTVVYVVDDTFDNGVRRRSIPTAMVFFILGLCTWVGYLFGMCYLRSPDPRERYWARACVMMCIIWSLIIIFATIFGRPHHNYNYGGYK
ncbi:MAG: hypothetical protein J3Q66DRAFT_321708 [Benniella sp.]|nr:MAG: hypothetical protein J3Q66DRAFT_321708 [Benniella sp.]